MHRVPVSVSGRSRAGGGQILEAARAGFSRFGLVLFGNKQLLWIIECVLEQDGRWRRRLSVRERKQLNQLDSNN
ncbi:hypothetical protein PAMP_008581 [Pampus punctatissimus]